MNDNDSIHAIIALIIGLVTLLGGMISMNVATIVLSFIPIAASLYLLLSDNKSKYGSRNTTPYVPNLSAIIESDSLKTGEQNEAESESAAENHTEAENQSKNNCEPDFSIDCQQLKKIMQLEYDLTNVSIVITPLQKAADSLHQISGYGNADELAKKCEDIIPTLQEITYLRAKKILSENQGNSGYKKALLLFQQIPEYRDSEDLAESCQNKISDKTEKNKSENDDDKWAMLYPLSEFRSARSILLKVNSLFSKRKKEIEAQKILAEKIKAQKGQQKFIKLPPGVDRSQLEAVGIEMKEGYWFLLKDGTMYFREGDYLGNGEYGRYKYQVKRIVIDDYNAVGLGAFAGFSECQEVIFTNPSVRIQNGAFMHCHKLETVSFAGEWEEIGEAFHDTPYEAKRQRVEFIPEYLRGSVIAKGEWGKKFLESVHKEIDLMYTPEGPKDARFVYDPDAENQDGYVDCECGFADSFAAIIRGAIAGEPDLMYLLAETLNYNLNGRMKDQVKRALTFLSDDYRNVSSRDLYIRAAEAGSAHAGLWCAFSMDTGKTGFSKDPQGSGEMLNKIEHIPHTLVLAELSFLPEEVDKLTQKAYAADLEEDEIADQHGFIAGTYEHLLPNPDWRQLHGRAGNTLVFMSEIGLPYVIGEKIYGGGCYSCDDDLNDEKIAEEKNAWLTWCHEKGIEIKLFV